MNHVADLDYLFGSAKVGQEKNDRLRIRVKKGSQSRKIQATELLFHTFWA